MTKLRAAFLALTLLMGLTSIYVGVRVNSLNHIQENVINPYVPDLVHSRQLESLLPQILSLHHRIDPTSDSGEISSAEKQIDALEDQLSQFIVEHSKLENSTAFTKIRQTIKSELRSSILSLSYVKSIANSKLSLSILRQDIQQMKEDFRKYIEPELIDSELAVAQLMDSIELQQTDTSELTFALKSQIYDQYTLTELSFLFFSAVDNAEQLTREIDPSFSDQNTRAIQHNIRNLTIILSTLSNRNLKRNLSDLILTFQSAVNDDAGILAAQSTIKEYVHLLDLSHEQQNQEIASISSLIAVEAKNAEKKFFSASQEFRNELRNTLVAAIVAASLIGLIMSIGTYFILEKQFNALISMLTDVLIDIANGDLTRDVHVIGMDDNGKIAQSLDVFKKTALQLQLSNQEMEQFAYAASHDLRSPLRAIENLA